MKEKLENKENLVFPWRNFLKNPEKISDIAASKLDELAGLVDEEFWQDLKDDKLRTPNHSFITYFRAILKPQEMKELFDAVNKCIPRGYHPSYLEK